MLTLSSAKRILGTITITVRLWLLETTSNHLLLSINDSKDKRRGKNVLKCEVIYWVISRPNDIEWKITLIYALYGYEILYKGVMCERHIMFSPSF